LHQLGSAILSYILSPFNWIVLLLIAGYLIKRKGIRRTCRITALIIFIIFSNAYLLNEYAKHWQPAPRNVSDIKVYSCGIVPGGFGSTDPDENGYFNISSDRFIQATKLFKAGKISHILINGGNGKKNKVNFREGVWAKKEFIAMDIPDSVVYVEDRSNNTLDNARHAKQILDSLALQPPYVLITSAYHVPRASVVFKNAGVAIEPFPCNYMNGRSVTDAGSFIPHLSVLYDWELFLKETIGYYYYK
jgi:uncharacterized SAM-binding protein YcdF (DUF218 family)